jgi:hypothetical protein
MSALPRLATFQHRGMVRLECATSTATLVVLLDASGPGGDSFADLRTRLPGVPIWAAVPPSGQPEWMWRWEARETRYIEQDPAASALDRVLGWVTSPLDLLIVAPGRLVTVDSLAHLGALVRPFLLVEKQPTSEIITALTRLGGGYVLRGTPPTPRLSLAPRRDVDASLGPRDISLPHHEWIAPKTVFIDDTWFDASLVAPWAGYELHTRHTASAASPPATDAQAADAPTGPLPTTGPRAKLDRRDGVAEGSIVFLRGGERITQPLHRVTEIRSATVDAALIVESGSKVLVSVTRGTVMVRNQRVDYGAPTSVMSREPFFIDGIMTHVEIKSFQGSTRPPVVQGEGKKTILGGFVISGTPVDIIERDPTRHELWVSGKSLVVRGRVQHTGDHERVDTFPDQARLDLSYLWSRARAETITGQDKMPLVLADETHGHAYNTSLDTRTRVALEFDLGAGTLTIVGEHYVSIAN